MYFLRANIEGEVWLIVLEWDFKEGIWLIVPDYFFKFEGGVRGCVPDYFFKFSRRDMVVFLKRLNLQGCVSYFLNFYFKF